MTLLVFLQLHLYSQDLPSSLPFPSLPCPALPFPYHALFAPFAPPHALQLHGAPRNARSDPSCAPALRTPREKPPRPAVGRGHGAALAAAGCLGAPEHRALLHGAAGAGRGREPGRLAAAHGGHGDSSRTEERFQELLCLGLSRTQRPRSLAVVSEDM